MRKYRRIVERVHEKIKQRVKVVSIEFCISSWFKLKFEKKVATIMAQESAEIFSFKTKRYYQKDKTRKVTRKIIPDCR